MPNTSGHGENEPQEEYYYEEFAGDMYQFITDLGLDKLVYPNIDPQDQILYSGQ